MTHDEFNQWLAYHHACYPMAMAKFFAGLIVPQAEVLRRWYACLRQCTLNDCKDASDDLVSNREPVPFGIENHPGAVRVVAMRHARQRGNAGLPENTGERLPTEGERAEFRRDFMEAMRGGLKTSSLDDATGEQIKADATKAKEGEVPF